MMLRMFRVVYACDDQARHFADIEAHDACAAIAALLRRVPNARTAYVVH